MARGAIYRSAKGEQYVKKKYQELLRHWPVEKQEYNLDTRHGKTFVIGCGSVDNPPLVLLHGACGNSLMWLKQVSSYLRAHRVYCVDIIGEATLSDATRPKRKANHYVDWLEDVLQHLGIQQTALAGFSFGAWIALNFTARFPDRIDRLALLSPSGVVKLRRSLRIKYFLLTFLTGPWGRRWMLGRLLQRNSDNNAAELTNLIAKYFKPRPWSLPRLFKQPMPPLYCPVLLMLGGKDPFYSTDKILLKIAHQIPQLELIVRAKEGHFLDDFTREVDRFLVTQFAPD